MDLSRPLNLIDVSAAPSDSVGGCGSDGCGCGHGGADAATETSTPEASTAVSTTAISTTAISTIVVGVTGMTCSHCVSSVSGMLSDLPGVASVDIDLRPDAVSFVTIDAEGPLDRERIREAVSAAGYTLTD